jgi:hypothetical protein
MARKDKGRKPSRKGGRSNPRLGKFLMIAGVLVVGLGASFYFAQDPSPEPRVIDAPDIEIASLPPLSTQGNSIRGWHDMANIPESFMGRPLPKDQPQPDVAVQPASRHLGALGRKDVVNLNYVVMNTGNKDLVINNVVTSCGCTTASLSHNIIPPGHRADLAVRFDVGYHPMKPGEQVTRVVWLKTNDPDTPVVEARLIATIK